MRSGLLSELDQRTASSTYSRIRTAIFDKNERAFDKGGIAAKSNIQPQTNATIATNEALMRQLHIYGTPGLVYLDDHERLRVFAGMPDPAQLRDIFGGK